MNYSFHPEAESELDEAINYYEECAEGLAALHSPVRYSLQLTALSHILWLGHPLTMDFEDVY